MSVARKATVVLCHYRSPSDLETCLDSLPTGFGDVPFDVVVCDSDAMPEAEVIVNRAAGRGIRAIYVPFAENVGFARMANAGIERASSPFIVIVNVDIVPTEGAYAALVDVLVREESIGIVGPQLVDATGERQDSAFRFHKLRTIPARRTPFGRTKAGQRELERFLMHDAGLGAGRHDVGWVSGAVMAVRRGAALRVGGMDSRYFLYFEDVDWCRRMWKGGWRVVYDADIRVEHRQGHGSRSRGLVANLRNRLTRVHIGAAVRYFRTHGVRTPSYGE